MGPLLRRWREARHLSQLDLVLEAAVSARHISFLETGRAQPSREMPLTPANVLDVPFRERNFLLLAASYVLFYDDTGLDHPRMAHMRSVVDATLKANDPRSAIAHDRHWNIVMANEAFARFLTVTLGKKPPGLEPLQVAAHPRLNLLRRIFDLNGLRRKIVNWEPIAKWLLNEAYRRLAWAREETLRTLIAEILSYVDVPSRWRKPDLEAPHQLIVPIGLNLNGVVARMFSTVTAVASPHDVTPQELHVEIFYAANAESEKALHACEKRTSARPKQLLE